MNRNISIAVFLLLPLLAFAQPDSCSFIIRFDGSYADTPASNGVSSLGASASNTREWNVGFTIGLPVGKHWEVGLGFEYVRMVSKAQSEIYLPNQWAAAQWTETKTNLFMGGIYAAGRWKLFNRCYFNPMFTVGIGKAKGVQLTKTAVKNIFPSDIITILPGTVGSLTGQESDILYQYLAIGVAPAFSFYLSRHFALNLTTGRFQFSTTDWKWDNKQWLASVNPLYWQLGIMLAF